MFARMGAAFSRLGLVVTGHGVAGGGETLAAIERSKMIKEFDYISTGGGAMLEFLAGKKLPGLVALQ